MFNLIGDIGGLWGALYPLIAWLISSTAALNLSSLRANRLFTNHQGIGVFLPSNRTNPEPSKTRRYIEKINKTPFEIPKFLFWKYFLNDWLCCCCKQKLYERYRNHLDQIDSHVARNSDIIQIMRRNKIVGFALASLLDKLMLKTISSISRSNGFVA